MEATSTVEGRGLFQSSGRREGGEGAEGGGSLLDVILQDPQLQEQALGSVL